MTFTGTLRSGMMGKQRRSTISATFALLISALISAGPGLAASKASAKKAPPVEPAMRVYIVRSAQEGCEPNCPEWIAAQGKIMPGTLGQFTKVLKQLGAGNLPVLVHSGGGLADEAIAIGRLLRTKGLDVAVARTTFTPCAPDAFACRKKAGNKPLRGAPEPGFSACASACAFILAGGKRRFVTAPAFVGVHRGEMILTRVLHVYRFTPYRASDGSIKVKKRLIQQKVMSERRLDTPEKVYNRYAKYFSEMGIEKQIMPLMQATPNESVHWLTGEELRSTRLATHNMNAAQLIDGTTAAGNGWAAPAAPLAPTLPIPGASGSDCVLRGTNCPWQFSNTLPGGASAPAASR